jgi:hypothetical protein
MTALRSAWRSGRAPPLARLHSSRPAAGSPRPRAAGLRSALPSALRDVPRMMQVLDRAGVVRLPGGRLHAGASALVAGVSSLAAAPTVLGGGREHAAISCSRSVCRSRAVLIAIELVAGGRTACKEHGDTHRRCRVAQHRRRLRRTRSRMSGDQLLEADVVDPRADRAAPGSGWCTASRAADRTTRGRPALRAARARPQTRAPRRSGSCNHSARHRRVGRCRSRGRFCWAERRPRRLLHAVVDRRGSSAARKPARIMRDEQKVVEVAGLQRCVLSVVREAEELARVASETSVDCRRRASIAEHSSRARWSPSSGPSADSDARRCGHGPPVLCACRAAQAQFEVPRDEPRPYAGGPEAARWAARA